ncbi:MAG: low molecular weight protein arginine phosphatase [Verrucomicrobia bacterium]|nr:low molecular weight protein arginine phosphatase [Verrucomicrobiota bacterium]
MAQLGHILTVCTANICRSPMAEVLLQHALRAQPEPLKSLKVLSAGVAAHPGDKVSENSVLALKKVGLDLTGHKAQPLSDRLVYDALAIFCMTESHRSMIELSFDPPPGNIYLFREFMPPPAAHEIGDPYGGSLKHYEACRDEMVEAIPSLVEFIKSLAASVPPAGK